MALAQDPKEMALVQEDKEMTAFSQPVTSTSTPLARPPPQLYITGLRGILVLESLVWTFLQLFVPAMVSSSTHGPTYQRVLRAALSVPFWNASLISAFFIILSARAICLTFLQNPCSATFASSLIHRPLRLSVSLSVALGLAILILSQLGTEYIDKFKSTLPNDSISVPAIPSSAVVALNSMFNLFWTVHDFSGQSGNTFWPSATLWAPSLIFYQSYTVYMLMALFPFTRSRWHTQAIALFTIGSFWLESWGWYSAAGLLLADFAIDSSLRAQLLHGFNIGGEMRCPPSVSATLLLLAGLAMKYAWASLPQYTDAELVLHPYFELSKYTTIATFDSTKPYPRLDDFFVIIGIMILVEISQTAQSVLSVRPLLFLGERSLSFFVAGSILLWTGGVWLFLHMHVEQELSLAASNMIVLAVCLPAVFVLAEAYHRLVDRPSRFFAKAVCDWLLN